MILIKEKKNRSYIGAKKVLDKSYISKKIISERNI